MRTIPPSTPDGPTEHADPPPHCSGACAYRVDLQTGCGKAGSCVTFGGALGGGRRRARRAGLRTCAALGRADSAKRARPVVTEYGVLLIAGRCQGAQTPSLWRTWDCQKQTDTGAWRGSAVLRYKFKHAVRENGTLGSFNLLEAGLCSTQK